MTGGEAEARINRTKTDLSQQYIFCQLTGPEIEELVRLDRGDEQKATSLAQRSIYRIWPDFQIKAHITKSISTVKADAARNAFSALGEGIVWAVMDSGIDKDHPHFRKHRNLELQPALKHTSFTDLEGSAEALMDVFGHGTHVAGIIAGKVLERDLDDQGKPVHNRISAAMRHRTEMGEVKDEQITDIPRVSGMAPNCKLLSLKVLDDDGTGQASNLIAACEYIQEINGNGRRIVIHGVNMSVGYDFEPEWFACGQSPLCVEVDRLVKSGVVVVVAAGNTGYGWMATAFRGSVAAGMELSINDPGNAELAITVGSTHREKPHTFGVSYFSSKGPTGDGRIKPDLVAPGEKIISCKSGSVRVAAPAAASASPTAPPVPPVPPPQTPIGPAAPPQAMAAEAPGGGPVAAPAPAAPAPTAPAPTAPAPAAPPAGAGARAGDVGRAATAPVQEVQAQYKEDSGTSMAAPHVSGVIASFLSVRREFIGQAEAVKKIFLATATDLNRSSSFQGKGLVDLMRAIQSV